MHTQFLRRRVLAGAMCATGLVLVAGLLVLSRQARPVTSVSDTAVIESYTLYASHGRLLVGPYSRYGWHHPGPLYLYLLTPFYLLSGKLTTGLNAGALTVNLVSLIVTAWVVSRSASNVLAIVTMTMLTVYTWRVAPMLTSPWNPHVIVLPTIAFAVIAAAVASGWIELLPLMAWFATFVAQTHLGVVPAVLAMSAIAVGPPLLAAVSSREAHLRQRTSRAASLAVCLMVVLWAAPLWEEITRSPGNLTKLWRFFEANQGGSQPFKIAYAAWTDMLSGIARVDFRLAEGSSFRRSRIPWAEGLAGGEIVLLATTAIAGRAGRRFGAALAALLVLGSVVALWSATRINDTIMDHEVFWISGFGVLVTAVLLDTAIAAVWNGSRRPLLRTTPVACAAAVVVVAAIGVSQLLVVTNRTLAPRPQQVAAATLGDALNRRVRRVNGRPLIKIDQDAWPIAAGVLLNLQKSSLPFAVEDDWLPMFTETAAATGRETEVVAIVGRERHFLLTAEGHAFTIADAEPFYLMGFK